MNKFLTFLRRCHIFHKRFYLKKGFIALLLMIPIIGLALSLTSRLDSGIMTVALVSEDGDPAAVEIIDSLMNDRGVVRFLSAETKQEAVSLVERGKADAAWIFVADFSAVSDKFAENQSARNALVHIVQREEGIAQKLLREKLSGALYPHISERFYLVTARETLAEAGVTPPNEATLLAYYQAQMPGGEDMFDFHFADKQTDSGGAVLTAPFRGLLSVVTVLAALAIAMFYKMDAQNGVFTGFSKSEMPFITFGYHFCGVLDISLAMVISLGIAGLLTSFWSELCYLLLFAVAASLFAMTLEKLCRRLSLLAALTPLSALIMIVVCPVFFTINIFGFLPYLFPPQYYIMGMAGAIPLWYTLAYIAMLCGAYALLSLTESKNA